MPQPVVHATPVSMQFLFKNYRGVENEWDGAGGEQQQQKTTIKLNKNYSQKVHLKMFFEVGRIKHLLQLSTPPRGGHLRTPQLPKQRGVRAADGTGVANQFL